MALDSDIPGFKSWLCQVRKKIWPENSVWMETVYCCFYNGLERVSTWKMGIRLSNSSCSGRLEHIILICSLFHIDSENFLVHSFFSNLLSFFFFFPKNTISEVTQSESEACVWTFTYYSFSWSLWSHTYKNRNNKSTYLAWFFEELNNTFQTDWHIVNSQ